MLINNNKTKNNKGSRMDNKNIGIKHYEDFEDFKTYRAEDIDYGNWAVVIEDDRYKQGLKSIIRSMKYANIIQPANRLSVYATENILTIDCIMILIEHFEENYVSHSPADYCQFIHNTKVLLHDMTSEEAEKSVNYELSAQKDLLSIMHKYFRWNIDGDDRTIRFTLGKA